jgi:hypothetical protein
MEIFWRIMEPKPPNLVISVVGGAKNFVLDGEMRETFSNGIIKVGLTYMPGCYFFSFVQSNVLSSCHFGDI